jgi:hypothetical protein
MKKKRVDIREAVGMVLFHDITGIIPGVVKGPAFKKGHKVAEEDIQKFLELGKEHLWVIEVEPGEIHEDDAAKRMARAFAGDNIEITDSSEGRINLISETKGMLKVRRDTLQKINSVGELMLATLGDHSRCSKGTMVAGTRIIPLVTEEERIRKIEDICGKDGPVVEVRPYRLLSWGLIITGNEVFSGRITDGFADVVEKKAREFGCSIIQKTVVPDDTSEIAEAMQRCRSLGAQCIIVTGGMSVDPDDVTPNAIRSVGAEIERYGAPILPGAMFLLAYWEGIPVLGIPACAVYYERTVMDRILPALLIGERVTYEDIGKMGHGGLCLGCPVCHFPACSFGTSG